MTQTSKINKLTDKEFIDLINSSSSYRDCLKKLNMSHGRHSYDLLKQRCLELNISTSHFTTVFIPNKKVELDSILVENSTYKNNRRLAKRLVSENKLEYKCKECGNCGSWNGKSLTLQLDHINGNHTDNRIENLRFLCPNCHTQTETYGSKCRAK